jgi:hypothetical protein
VSSFRHIEVWVKRYPGIEPLNEAATMTDKSLLFVTAGCRNDDQLNPLVPRHVLVAETTDCRLFVHWIGTVRNFV